MPPRSSSAELGAAAGTVRNGTPLPDFGGHHPDPNLVHAKELYDVMMGEDAPDFGAASDGDGDRNLIIGRGIFITPSDSLAMLAANAHLAPGYAAGLAGIARSMPTSAAADRVAAKLGIGMLRDADGLEVLRQPARRRSRHHLRRGERRHRLQPRPREGRPLGGAALAQHPRRPQGAPPRRSSRRTGSEYGRNYYARHDYEGIDTAAANGLMDAAPRQARQDLPGAKVDGLTVADADDFAYHDPVDGSISAKQGIRILFEGGSRVVFRLSGTGTSGATLRVYIERYEDDPEPPRPRDRRRPRRPDPRRRGRSPASASAPAAPSRT